MPFTFSHPALILPLNYLPKKWFSMTVLIIGSLTPDFEYFIRMRVHSIYSHSLEGLFWFDLPLGIILCFIFHNIVKSNLIDNTPNFLFQRLSVFNSFNWNNYFIKNFAIVILSIILGASSHLLWDSFTHPNGFFVNKISFFSETVSLYKIKIPNYKLIQHSSSFFGGIVVVLSLLLIPKSIKLNNQISIKYWLLIFVFTFLIIFLRLFFGLDYKLYGHLIATAISAFLISLIITPLITIKKAQKNF